MGETSSEHLHPTLSVGADHLEMPCVNRVPEGRRRLQGGRVTGFSLLLTFSCPETHFRDPTSDQRSSTSGFRQQSGAFRLQVPGAWSDRPITTNISSLVACSASLPGNHPCVYKSLKTSSPLRWCFLLLFQVLRPSKLALDYGNL